MAGAHFVLWGTNMVSIVSTVAYLGLEARSVEVQCQVAPGMVGFAVVGLPDKAVAESRERVRAAISALGLGATAQADHHKSVACGPAERGVAL